MDARTYDVDFVEWTQQQAAALRARPLDVTALDTKYLAEEIEDIGREHIREVSSLVTQTLIHLLKLHLNPSSPSAFKWFDEALRFQAEAVLALSPGIKQHLDLDTIWRKAKKVATIALASHRSHFPEVPDECPLSLDALLSEDFDPNDALRICATAIK